MLGGLRGAGQGIRSAVGGQSVDQGLKALNKVTFGGFGSTVGAGASVIDLVRGNGLNGPLSKQANRRFKGPGELAGGALSGLQNITIQQPGWTKNLLSEPSWLSQLNNTLPEPGWITTLTNPTITEPSWLNTLENPPLPEPGWIPQLDTSINVETPPWADALTDGLDARLDVQVPSPQLDLKTGSIRSEIDEALDGFTDEVVDEAVQEVKRAFDLGGQFR
ncbi:hypothetical protein NDI56_03945 [Haloarcula sp. S1CR25-12]|uniref:Uncharacterized protein n=1 Tax=Haloarcula saliterrae TaxID=2950534 RepID=A0ABU2F8G4_9EURY|nr:hypothetical protein [Haloarcula sp. S1CR25-12]